ncbi:unnamed protein product [Leptosia nina]|uniref:Calponin-homology (CH) domain-containing protein n=1 Tax=Leptosia nina TaxID=320188 RepID=A0AAV1JIN1_9NEOP
MARKYMERKLSKSHRSTIPTSFKVPEPFEFYNKATPFVQRTLLFVADENSGPKAVHNASENDTQAPEEPGTSKSHDEKSPKKSSFFFSPSKSCKIHGRSFFRLQTSPKKSKAEACDVATGNRGAGAPGPGGLISYAPGWSLKGEHLMKWQESGKTTIEIYTDWANHYLERARSRRRAGTSGGGLARDCADGLLLADVLEGVTGQKVPRAHRKPRNPQQMPWLENVQCCLDFLHAQKVQGLESVTAVDIRDAKLKAVLALFFALSRHKQASKQRITPPSGHATNSAKNSNEDVAVSSVQRITGGSSGDDILTVCGNNIDMTTLAANR